MCKVRTEVLRPINTVRLNLQLLGDPRPAPPNANGGPGCLGALLRRRLIGRNGPAVAGAGTEAQIETKLMLRRPRSGRLEAWATDAEFSVVVDMRWGSINSDMDDTADPISVDLD